MEGKSERRVEKSVVVLSEDLVVEIMSRVPVKDLMRFRCVSKPFSSLIDSDPYLSRRQFQPSFVFENMYYTAGKVTIHNYWVDLDSLEDQNNDVATKIYNPFYDDDPHHDALVIGSCHGLLLLRRYGKGCFAVLNPATKNYHLLPAVDDKLLFAGFGYDSVHDTYKVVTVMAKSTTNRDALELMIYNGTWRKVVTQFQGYNNHDMRAMKCLEHVVNGAVYWYKANPKDNDQMSIIGFKLEQEELFEVVTPDFGNVLYDHIDMTVFDGRLCVVYKLGDYRPERIDLWVVDEEWCWTKLLSISKPEEKLPCQIRYRVVPICYLACRTKILFDVNRVDLCWYHLERWSFTRLNIYNQAVFKIRFDFAVTSFIRSLVGNGGIFRSCQ